MPEWDGQERRRTRFTNEEFLWGIVLGFGFGFLIAGGLAFLGFLGPIAP